VQTLLDRVSGKEAIELAASELIRSPAVSSEIISFDGLEPSKFMRDASIDLVAWHRSSVRAGQAATEGVKMEGVGQAADRVEAPLSCSEALRIQNIRAQTGGDGIGQASGLIDFIELHSPRPYFRNAVAMCCLEAASHVSGSYGTSSEHLGSYTASGLPVGLLLTSCSGGSAV